MKMVAEEVAPRVVMIVLDGRLDITGAAIIDLQFTAIAAASVGVVVDLASVSFLASLGIRTLLLAAKAVHRRGGSFVLLNPVDSVEEVLVVSGLTGLLPIYRDSGTALAAVSR